MFTKKLDDLKSSTVNWIFDRVQSGGGEILPSQFGDRVNCGELFIVGLQVIGGHLKANVRGKAHGFISIELIATEHLCTIADRLLTI